MTMSGFIAQLGGQISLWIGGSIISIIQLVVYMMTGACIFLQNPFHRGRNEEQKMENTDSTRNNGKRKENKSKEADYRSTEDIDSYSPIGLGRRMSDSIIV